MLVYQRVIPFFVRIYWGYGTNRSTFTLSIGNNMVCDCESQLGRGLAWFNRLTQQCIEHSASWMWESNWLLSLVIGRLVQFILVWFWRVCILLSQECSVFAIGNERRGMLHDRFNNMLFHQTKMEIWAKQYDTFICTVYIYINSQEPPMYTYMIIHVYIYIPTYIYMYIYTYVLCKCISI